MCVFVCLYACAPAQWIDLLAENEQELRDLEELELEGGTVICHLHACWGIHKGCSCVWSRVLVASY